MIAAHTLHRPLLTHPYCPENFVIYALYTAFTATYETTHNAAFTATYGTAVVPTGKDFVWCMQDLKLVARGKDPVEILI